LALKQRDWQKKEKTRQGTDTKSGYKQLRGSNDIIQPPAAAKADTNNFGFGILEWDFGEELTASSTSLTSLSSMMIRLQHSD